MRIILTLLAALILSAPLARADVDGSVPSPGNCAYPGVGPFGASFGEYDFYCAFPTEINGSHWQVLYGGGMWQVQAGLSATFVMVGVSVSATVPAGVLRGITYWACPDLSFAEQPNPPGAWQHKLTPEKCKSIGPMPKLIRDGDPLPPAPPQIPGISQGSGVVGDMVNPTLSPAVTDPTPGNPLLTENPPRR